jgi:hypothetical protein
VEWYSVYWVYLTLDRDNWLSVVNTVVEFQMQYNLGILLTS